MVNEIKLDPESLQLIVQQAIMESITPEAREKLMQDAITNLIAIPPNVKDRWGKTIEAKSILVNSFEDGVRAAAGKIVRDMVANDPKVQQALRDAIHPVVYDLCENNWDNLPELVGEAFATWMKNRDR